MQLAFQVEKGTQTSSLYVLASQLEIRASASTGAADHTLGPGTYLELTLEQAITINERKLASVIAIISKLSVSLSE